MALSTAEFEKKISHLDQVQVLTGAVSALNQILMEKGLVSADELQEYFLRWLMDYENSQCLLR